MDRGQLLRVRQTRKDIEQDEILLENRLKRAQAEESRMLRKLELSR